LKAKSIIANGVHILFLKIYVKNQAKMLVAHAYNPSYSGGRNQEDHGLKPAKGK
jgi:hypothetical protein